MNVTYQNDYKNFELNFKELLKKKARESKTRGDKTNIYAIKNDTYPNLSKYIIEATSFEGAILKYFKLVKTEYKENELSILLEELHENCDEIPITIDIARKWLLGKTKQPPPPFNNDKRCLYQVIKK